jgi:60 kDa SS-A/Ro ribonucleoprotein
VLVSDYESWIGTGRHGSTALMTEWQEFVKNQVRLQGADMIGPKLICINLQPSAMAQAPEPSVSGGGLRSDILNVGGFSDAVFGVVAAFLGDDAGRFVAEVEAIEL